MKSSKNHEEPQFRSQAPIVVFAVFCSLLLLSACDGRKETTNSKTNSSGSELIAAKIPPLGGRHVLLDSMTQKIKDSGGDWNIRSQAIKVVMEVGEQKRCEATASLLNGLFVIQPFSIDNVADFSTTYPCSVALVNIGDLAVPQIQSRFLANFSAIEQLVLLHTLAKIKGADFVASWLASLQYNGNSSLGDERRRELQ